MATGWKWDAVGGLRYRKWRIFPSTETGSVWCDIYTPAFVYAGSANGRDAVMRFVNVMRGDAVEMPQDDEWSREPVGRLRETVDSLAR